MRIISGTLRGRRLYVPPQGVRPTADRTREALFSVLGPEWSRRRVLDAFAGSGALGFEAISRGAEHATLVDRDRKLVGHLKKLVEKWDVQDRVTLVAGDTLAQLKRMVRSGDQFHIIFLDPPYDGELLEKALPLARDLLADGGRIVAEHHKRTDCPACEGLAVEQTRTYASTTLTLLVKPDRC